MSHYSTRKFDPSQRVGFLIKRGASLLSMVGETVFESQPISPAGFMALMSLREKSRMSPSELSTKTGYDMGRLTWVVDALEQAGLVKRDRGRADRRAVQITINTLGIRQARRSLATIVRLLNPLLEPFSQREFDTMVSLLRPLIQRLQGFVETRVHAQPGFSPSEAAKRSTRRAPR